MHRGGGVAAVTSGAAGTESSPDLRGAVGIGPAVDERASATPASATPATGVVTRQPRTGVLARIARAGVSRVTRRPFDVALRLAVLAASSWQLVDLLGRSSNEYGDYALTTDFATFEQAWWQLGRGNLDPYDTLGNHPFWKDQFNLTFWPLGLLHLVSSSPFTLLVVQDSCIALTTLLAGWWVCDAVARRLGERRFTAAAIVAATSLALALDPWAFETAFFDYHAEPMALVFLLLAGRALWNRKRHSPFLWALLACLTCSAGATLTLGLGIGASLTSRDIRRRSLGVAAIGLVMIGVIVLLGANQGTQLGGAYGYLAGRAGSGNSLGTGFTILGGVLRHPSLPVSTLWSRRSFLEPIFTAGGVLGVFSGWGLGIAVIDVLSSGLNSTNLFVQMTAGGFQNFPAVVFLLVGSALTVTWLASARQSLLHRLPPLATRIAGLAVGLAALASSLALAAQDDPGIQARWISVWGPGEVTLAQIARQIPQSVQVVISQGFVGRFAERQQVVPYIVPDQSVPLRGSVTWFVIGPAVGIETVPHATAWQALSVLQSRYHGTLVASNDGIAAVVVHRSQVPGGAVDLPPAGTG